MIEQLVAELPEVYQPIYGHSDFSDHASRPCADRLEVIGGIYDALQALLGRPLKVLDLGCAQGYFSLSLASRGAVVRGVDFLDKNIAVCMALAQENPQFNAAFEVGRVEDVIDQLQPGEYDLVLGLSVFHHVIHERGIDEVKRLFQHAASQCGAMILEIALQEGDLYWAASQPEDPLVLLESVTFVCEAARFKTHLTNVQRPLYLASNNYWVVKDKAGRFDTWTNESHALANNTHEGTRRYFFCQQEVVKLYRFVGPRADHNRLEFLRERMFLTNAPPDYPLAEPIVISESEREGWVVMQRLQGELLLDVLDEPLLDRKGVLRDILEQLVKLESFGLCHSDVRSWNVLVTEGAGARLIDYGAISQEFKDCVWPHNIYLAFMVFVHELATGHVANPSPIRQIAITPFNLPQPFRSWAAGLWAVPVQQWSFRLMLEHLNALGEDPIDGNPERSEEFWMQAIEEAIDLHSGRIRDLGGQFLGKSDDMEAQIERVRARVERVAEIALDVQGSMKDVERRAVYSEAVAEQLRLQLQDAGLRIQSAERRSHETELALRESINRAAQAEVKRVAAESLNDSLREQSRQSTSELLDLYKSHQKVAIQFEIEQQRRVGLEAQVGGLEERARVLEAERDLVRVDAIGTQAQIEYLEGHPKHLSLQIEALTEQLLSIEGRKQQLSDELNMHMIRTHDQDARFHEMSQRLDAALSDTHQWYLQANAHEARVNALLKSTSWRITWPLRICMQAISWLVMLPVRAVKWVVRSVLVKALRYLLRNPEVFKRVNNTVKSHPRIWAHLKQFALHRGLMQVQPESSSLMTSPSSRVFSESGSSGEGAGQVNAANLSPRVSRVYSELKAAIECKGIN